jgi:hypothetical protein
MRAYKPISYADYCTPDHSNPAECKNEVDGFNEKILNYNRFIRECREARRREDERSYAERRRERMRAARQGPPDADKARGSGAAAGGGTTIRAQSEPEKPAPAAAGATAVRSADSTERPRAQSGAGCVGYAQRFTYVDGSGNSVTDICFRDKCCGPTH